MTDSFTDTLRDRLIYEGLCEVGFSRIDETVPPDLAKYHYAVTLMYRLSDAVVDEIELSPTYAYFQHYRAANALLDRCALIACEMLRREGASAYPIAASQSVHDRGDKYTGIYQHKSAAVAAGLGWIGKSALFVSPRHGPRVRLATVLTDAELPCTAKPMESQCGECTLCVKACPSGAILGRNYVRGMAREEIFDAEKCSRHMKQAFGHIGRGAVCGLCMKACPVGRSRSFAKEAASWAENSQS